MEKYVRVPLFKLPGPVFQNCQQNESSKHRKVATYGTNQAEGVQEVRRTFSPQQRQTRLRTVRPQCASGEPQIRRNHSQPRQESRAESAQPPQHCPRAVSDSAGAGCSLHTEAGHRVWDSEPVSSGIPSWSDAKEEGTMEPATWCCEVPHLQWWCSTRSCLHNYGSSLCHVNIKKWWMWIWFNSRLRMRILPWCRMVSPLNSKCATSLLELSAPDHNPSSRSGRFPGRSAQDAYCSWHVALSHRFAG